MSWVEPQLDRLQRIFHYSRIEEDERHFIVHFTTGRFTRHLFYSKAAVSMFSDDALKLERDRVDLDFRRDILTDAIENNVVIEGDLRTGKVIKHLSDIFITTCIPEGRVLIMVHPEQAVALRKDQDSFDYYWNKVLEVLHNVEDIDKETLSRTKRRNRKCKTGK